MSTGINRHNGKRLTGFAHVEQSIRTILFTPPGSRLMRRSFGSYLKSLLGRENLDPETILKAYMAIAVAVAMWEPRYRLRSVTFVDNDTADIRQGRFTIRMNGEYMPWALDGDFTVDNSISTLLI